MQSPWQYLPGDFGFDPSNASILVALVLVVGILISMRRSRTIPAPVLGLVGVIGLMANAFITGQNTFSAGDAVMMFLATVVSLVTAIAFSVVARRVSPELRLFILLAIAALMLEDLRFLTHWEFRFLFRWSPWSLLEFFAWLGAFYEAAVGILQLIGTILAVLVGLVGAGWRKLRG